MMVSRATADSNNDAISLRFSLLLDNGWVRLDDDVVDDVGGELSLSLSASTTYDENAGDDAVDMVYTTDSSRTPGDGIYEDPSLALRLSVETWIITILCSDTEFYIIKADGGDLCSDLRPVDPVQPKTSTLVSVITQKVNVEVSRHFDTSIDTSTFGSSSGVQMPTYAFEWTQWELTFPILAVGTKYEREAFFAVIEKDGNVDSANVWRQAAEYMERDGQLALDSWIDSGRFDTLLRNDGHDNVVASSIVGLEDITFQNALRPLAVSAAGDNATEGYTEPLNPALFHPLRIAGIALLLFTIIVATLMAYIAAVRKRDREAEEALIKTSKGGLTTEEGLNRMLDAGTEEVFARSRIKRGSVKRKQVGTTAARSQCNHM
mmetsp:Transcript_15325/g.33328  ORF Transcript_15325/g.33328 Transcript_15325/m.33328 type:complete len:377 (-) Transcript_15325:56-1186(-)